MLVTASPHSFAQPSRLRATQGVKASCAHWAVPAGNCPLTLAAEAQLVTAEGPA